MTYYNNESKKFIVFLSRQCAFSEEPIFFTEPVFCVTNAQVSAVRNTTSYARVSIAFQFKVIEKLAFFHCWIIFHVADDTFTL